MTYPKLQPTNDNRFRLLENYTIKGVTIPKGFITDGLTLKIRLLKLIVDKYAPKFSPFFIFHDYLCDKDRYIEADTLGVEILYEIEHSLRTIAMMLLIRLYHKLKYGVKYG